MSTELVPHATAVDQMSISKTDGLDPPYISALASSHSEGSGKGPLCRDSDEQLESILRLSPFKKLFSHKDLVKLSQSSKRIRNSVRRGLYADINLVWWGDNKIPRIPSLAQSIVVKPELAMLITSVKLGGDLPPLWRGYNDKVCSIPVSKAELELPILFVKDLNLDDFGTQWIEGLRNGSMDAFIATALIGHMFRLALCKPGGRSLLPKFDHLEEVTFIKHLPYGKPLEYRFVRNTDDLLPLFYLPEVKHMTLAINSPGSYHEEVQLRWPSSTNPHRPSKLRSLDLKWIREHHLEQLLQVTTGLESLTWEWYHRCEFEDKLIKPVINLDQIAKALSHVRDTLTHLNILACVEPGGQYIEEPTVPMFGSLQSIRDFTALKSFCVPLPFLAASLDPETANPLDHALPRNLETFTLADALCELPNFEWNPWDLVEAIALWLGNWRVSTPNLRLFRLVVVDTAYGSWDHTSKVRKAIVKLCKRAGLDVEIPERESKL